MNGSSWRRLLGWMLALALLWPPGGAFADPSGHHFADVPESHPEFAHIRHLADRQMIDGYPDGRFGPDDPLTRAEAAKLTVQVAGLPPRATGNSLPLTDVPQGHWGAGWISAAVDRALLPGYQDGSFHPDEPITRTELAALVLLATRMPTDRLPAVDLTDVDPGEPARPLALLAVAAGLMEAPGGRFRPDAFATRAEAARAFAQALVYTPLAYDIPLEPLVTPLRGTVELARPGGGYQAITAPTPLKAGGRIRTGGASAAELRFPDGSSLYLEANSELDLIRSNGTQTVDTTLVEDLEVELIRGRLFGALVPLFNPEPVSSAPAGVQALPLKVASTQLPPGGASPLLAAQTGGAGAEPSVARLLLFTSPASLEPGDDDGAELTVILADAAGNPVVAEGEPVTVQLLSDTGRFSNSRPVIPVGYHAVTVQLYPAHKEPPDAKTRVTAVLGEVTTSLTVPTASIPWWKALFTKRVRAKVRMPWSVASVRGSYISASVTPTDNSLSVLTGSASLQSALGHTAHLGGSESSSLADPTQVPLASPLTGSEAMQWSAQQSWVTHQTERLGQNAPTRVAGAVTAETREIISTLFTLPTDPTAPTLAITGPTPGIISSFPTATITGRVSDNINLKRVTVNGVEATVDARGNWSARVDLIPGENLITAEAVDGSGNRATATTRIDHDPTLPSITMEGPSVTHRDRARVTGRILAPGGLESFTLNTENLNLSPDGSFGAEVLLKPGLNRIRASVTDRQGRSASAEVLILWADQPPLIGLTEGPTTTAQPIYTLSGWAAGQGAELAALSVNGRPLLFGADGSFKAAVALQPGSNQIVVTATDAAGLTATATRTVLLVTEPPTLTLTAPQDGQWTEGAKVAVTGQVSHLPPGTVVAVNGVPVATDAAGIFSSTVALELGTNTIRVTAGPLDEVRTITRLRPLSIAITSPSDGAVVTSDRLTLIGTVQGAHGKAQVRVNGEPASLAADGRFQREVALKPGSNLFTTIVTDGAGRQASASVAVIRDPVPAPSKVSLANCTITVASSSVAADGAATTLVTVHLRDAEGHLVDSDRSLVLSTTLGTLGTLAHETTGTYVAVLTAPAAPGTATISATFDGQAVPGTATVHFVAR